MNRRNTWLGHDGSQGEDDENKVVICLREEEV